MKNLLKVMGFVTIMVLVAMPLMAQGTISVPQVQVGTFSSSGTGLSTGSGERQMTVTVSFPKSFSEKPKVIVGLTMIDAAGNVGTRVNAIAEGISRDGFTVIVKTWADSKVYGVSGSWVAIAPTTVKVKP